MPVPLDALADRRHLGARTPTAYCSATSRMNRAYLGFGVGVLSGMIVGSLHRTEVWSPMVSAR